MLAHVDLPMVEALRGEWRRHPPVHHLVAAYLDYEAPSDEPPQLVTDFDGLAAELGHVPVRHAPQIDTTAFDQAMMEKANG